MGKIKLTNEQIDEIKRLYRPSKGGRVKGQSLTARSFTEGSMSWLAEKFGVSAGAIHAVVHGERKKNRTREERFLSYVHKHESGCWLWQGGIDQDGYGDFAWSSLEKGVPAHRASYRLFRGEIPKGLGVLHTCDVRACVNPEHLFVGTHEDNMKDMIEKRRHNFGENNPASVLNNDQVRQIRSRYKNKPSGRPKGSQEPDKNSLRSLAKEFSVSKRTIQNVIQGRTFRLV